MAACEEGRLTPPRDVHDAGAWDEYWRNQLKVGAPEQGLSDWMASDETLAPLLTRRDSRTVLCAGNGLSTEALSLALLGFAVTALDISGVPGEVFGEMFLDPQHPLRQIQGFSMGDGGVLTFGAVGSIDPELCPPMHRTAEHPPRAGGRLSFVTGDLSDPGICHGPYDVVIERRTLQLFPEAERLVALDGLVARLSKRGVLVSQEHQGCWKPGDDRSHYAEKWLASKGFLICSTTVQEPAREARLACLSFTSG